MQNKKPPSGRGHNGGYAVHPQGGGVMTERRQSCTGGQINPRINITTNWDKTHNVSLDGVVVLEHRSRAECEQSAKILDTKLAIMAAQFAGEQRAKE